MSEGTSRAIGSVDCFDAPSSIHESTAMTNPDSLERRQMAEPAPAPEGADVGGMQSTADAGIGRATERSAERAGAEPVAPPATGNATGKARGAGGEAQSPRQPRPSGAFDDEEDEWRHEPREPVDESPLDSFGKAVGDALTGSVGDAGPERTTSR